MKEGRNMSNNIPQNRLREFRNRSRLTLDEVSAITGYTPATISRHEGGTRALTEESITKYSKLYKIHTYEIFIDPSELQDEDNA